MKGVVVPKCIPEAHRATQTSAGGALIPKFKSTLVALATVAAGAVLAASPASATGSSWTKTVNTSSPPVALTDTLVSSAVLAPDVPPPSTGVVSSVSYSWKMLGSNGQIPSGKILRVWLCAETPTETCIRINNDTIQLLSGSGSTTYFAGLPASTTYVYKYMLYYNGLRQPISPQFYSSMYSVTVNYDY